MWSALNFMYFWNSICIINYVNERQENYINWIIYIAAGYCFVPLGIIILNFITNAQVIDITRITYALIAGVIGIILLLIVYNRLEEKNNNVR